MQYLPFAHLFACQIIRAILKNPDDKTIVSLIFANIALEDILLKDELDGLAAGHDNFTVHYTLDKVHGLRLACFYILY